ncbi:MAG: hypothetical protein TR69_WS6001000573 [candidate division WS6 bacterium OLB20]|uniref:KH type-2 domain-containing protein n=1 Tax=candidate division WS6 bacterium OLB20 TaxID=1617426 RepID=A0A136LY92_9BACT|nr:MAG: hypothetical protein TR69_WS6001000573 [candidate division WS6 bacterium OLB20]
MKELLYYLLSNMVADPATIEISEESDGENVTLTVDMPEEEKGMVIGKGGMNIKSIRNLVSIIARRDGKKVYVKIAD